VRTPASSHTNSGGHSHTGHARSSGLAPTNNHAAAGRQSDLSPHPEVDDDVDALRSSDVFAGLPDGEIEEIAAHCTVATAHPGQVVQAQDVPVRLWNVIMSGHAVVQRDATPIGLLGRGNSWSEHSLLNQVRSSIAVVAFSPLRLLTMSRRDFFQIPDRHPVLAGRLVARAAWSADRLALPIFNALADRSDTE
jgi:CRP-like cAMP-binding protein